MTTIVVHTDDTKFESGIECRFFRWGAVGVKMWPSSLRRDCIADRQRTAYDEGLGPKVYDDDITVLVVQKLDNGTPHVHKMWGYTTEIVKTRIEEAREIEEYREYTYTYDWPTDELEEVKDRCMYDLGLSDLHSNNFGRRRDGKLVCLDFGNGSPEWDDDYDGFGDEEESCYDVSDDLQRIAARLRTGAAIQC
jgi:hypothetical protein